MADATPAPDPKEGETHDVRWAIAELSRRRADLDRRWEFYEGSQAEVFLSEKIRRAMSKLSRHFRFNYSRTVVTATLDRLNPAAYIASDDRAQATLDDLQSAVEWEDLEAEARELALVHGDAYLIVWPEEFADLRADADTLDDTIELGEVLDISIELEAATGMVAQYHPRRKSTVRVAARTWALNGRRYVELYYNDRLERWAETAPRSDHYSLDTSWADAGVWTYPDTMPERVPVFPISTSRTGYGRAVHEDAIGPQAAIDKLVTGLMATIDYSGAPIRYGLMHEQDTTSSAAYDDLEDVDLETDTEVEGAAVKSPLRSGPGDFWLLDLKEVGEFAQATVSTYLDPWAASVRNMASLTATPVHLFEGFAGNVSGEAIRSAEAPLVKKVGKLQRLIAAGEEAALEYALDLLGHPDATVSVAWDPPQFADDSDAWTVAQSKLTVGLPLRQVLLEQGYDPDLLDELNISTDPEAPDAATVASLISRLAIAVPNILSAAQARRIVALSMGLDEDYLEDTGATVDARALAEMVQKIYLGVGTVITVEEARDILNAAGGNLDQLDAPPEPSFA